MATVDPGDIRIDLERPFGERRQAQPVDDAADIRTGQLRGSDNALQVRQVLGRAVDREAYGAQGQVEIRNDVPAIEKVLPRSEPAVGPERQLVDRALHVEVEDVGGIRRQCQRLDNDIDRPGPVRVQVRKFDSVNLHPAKRNPITVEIVINSAGFGPRVPVAATIAQQFDPRFDVANVQFFDDQRAAYQRPCIDDHGEMTDTQQLRVRGPVRIAQGDVFGDQPGMPAKLQLETPADIQLVADSPRGVALDLLLVNREVGFSEVDEQGQGQDDQDSQRPGSDAEYLAHRFYRLRPKACGRYRPEAAP